jgi:CRISPR-associated protein (TIGR02710 family)
MLTSPDDVEKCAEEAKQAILEALDRGATLGTIDADFTSGTKAMTAGLAIATTALGAERLVYVTGERESRTGRVLSGTERVVSVYPVQLTIDANRRQLKTLFNRRLFDSGLVLVAQVLDSCLRPDVQQEFNFWKRLFETYREWDRFDHQRAADGINKIPKEYLKLLNLDLDPNKELLGRLSNKLGTAWSARKQKRETSEAELLSLEYCPEILADLLANADRRADEGKYDDAVARLYRAAELVGQIALAGIGIDSSNVRPNQVPDAALELFREGGRAQQAVGLDKKYRLLSALEDERAELYLKNRRLRSLLKTRNNSILAHGTTAVGGETFESLRQEVIALARAFVPELEKHRLVEKAGFPEIKTIF